MTANPSGASPDQEVRCALEWMEKTAELSGRDEEVGFTQSLMKRLAESTLEVAVVGEPKRGKSSLVNALIGRDVAPVGALPLTGVPTFIEDGEDGCVVDFEDGRSEMHPFESAAHYISEDANPGNHLRVESVTLRLPSGALPYGTRLVDTPGVGSVLEHETHSTHRYLPRLDAAILVLSADPPISSAEVAFLDRILEHAAALFVVLNKADYLSDPDRERTVRFTREVVARRAPSWDGRVYALSARRNVGDPAALERFLANFNAFLEDRRAETLVSSVALSGARTGAALRRSVELERRAAGFSLTDLVERRERMQAGATALDHDVSGERTLILGAVRNALARFDREIERALPQVRDVIVAETRRRGTELAGRQEPHLLETLRSERVALLAAEGRVLAEAAERAALGDYRRTVESSTDRVASRLARFTDDVAGIFEVALPTFQLQAEADEVPGTAFTYVRSVGLYDQARGIGWRLLGARGAGKAIDRAAAEAAEEINMYFGKRRGRLSETLTERSRRSAVQLAQAAEGLRHGLLDAVDRAGARIAETEERQASRNEQLDEAARLLDAAERVFAARSGARLSVGDGTSGKHHAEAERG